MNKRYIATASAVLIVELTGWYGGVDIFERGVRVLPVVATEEMAQAAWESDGTDYVGEHHRICQFGLAYDEAVAAFPDPLDPLAPPHQLTSA